MKVISRNKLQRLIGDEKKLRQKFGHEMARKIQLRINSLNAAESLADYWPPNSTPERCHELKGDLKGYFSIDLKHPYRLLIVPSVSISKDEQREVDRWKQITEVEIIRVENTHG